MYGAPYKMLFLGPDLIVVPRHTRASTNPLVVPYVPRYPDILNLLGVDIQQAGPYIMHVCVNKRVILALSSLRRIPFLA